MRDSPEILKIPRWVLDQSGRRKQLDFVDASTIPATKRDIMLIERALNRILERITALEEKANRRIR